MKFTVARPSRPRNPMVAQALFRQAGSHRRQESARRQQSQRSLANELRERSRPDSHSP